MQLKRTPWRHRGRHVIRYYSHKAGTAMLLESFLELWYATKLELCADVKTFAAQPESMHTHIDGKLTRFSPDFLVAYHDGTAKYIEVHHQAYTNAQYRQKVALFDVYSQKMTGVPIELITPTTLNTIELVNFTLLSQYPAGQQVKSMDTSDLPKTLTFQDLIEVLREHESDPLLYVYQLLSMGVYHFDYSQLLNVNTPLCRSQAYA